jgi:hypothetical protein
VKTEHAVVSFLRHADLSPDGHSLLLNTKGNPASWIPLRTHRWDESDRVFLAGCSSAEPASACSIQSAYQNLYVRFVSDPPAGPCVFGDCAREFRLPIHPIVCFEVGRFTLTQSSWTVSRRCSRKWMSGRAATALVLLRDRGQFGNLSIYSPGEPILPGQGESPFPLDFYLPWMSLAFPHEILRFSISAQSRNDSRYKTKAAEDSIVRGYSVWTAKLKGSAALTLRARLVRDWCWLRAGRGQRRRRMPRESPVERWRHKSRDRLR